MMISSESPVDENVQISKLCVTSNCVYNVTLAIKNDSLFYNESEQHRMVCVLEASPEDFLASRPFQAFIYLMYSAVFVIALVGNGLVCFVVHKTPRMKTVTNYFIVNLAVGDILMTLFCVPFSFVSMLVLRYWPFGAVMCKVVNYVQAVSVFVSAYTLLAISIDRYMAIMRPLQPRLGRLRAKLVVAAVWGGALATASPIPIVSQLQKPSPWHVACQVDICGELWANSNQSEQYTFALLALQFMLPLSVLVCTYARIAYVVWGVRPPGEAESARDSRLHNSKRKMVKMMVTVVAVFVICWLPLNVFIVLWVVHAEDDSWGAWPGMPYVWFASHWLAMSHSCYNPVIYCYMNARYRRGFNQIFGALMCLKKTEEGSCHRPSICEGLPLSELAGSSVRRRRGGCSCRLPRDGINMSNGLSVRCTTCTSVRQARLAPCRGPDQGAPGGQGHKAMQTPSSVAPPPPVRALSIRSEFTYQNWTE